MKMRLIFLFLFVTLFMVSKLTLALPSSETLKAIQQINEHGPYLGLVVPNAYEMDPLLQSQHFKPSKTFPILDLQGRRFHIGRIHKHGVIVVMSGLSMLNSGLTTQLLLSFFSVKGIIHFGIAGNADPSLYVGYVTIPQYWAHTGLWNWQRFGDGPNDELSLEVDGDYTRKLGYLHFTKFTTPSGNSDNLLNNVWYQPEEVFPTTGTPEVREHAFWVPVDKHYYQIAKKLENFTLESCLNATTCLSHTPKVLRVEKGSSANVFVDNGAYRDFIHTKFNITAIDMESAAVALVCLEQGVPFIVIRALSDLAGGSSQSNEASVFGGLASQNAADTTIQFLKLLS
ncbi:hypothetical protein SUGI_0606750 [Cryptomeria japonica]|uniref:bark storage protein A n=1 Tax=Cryptomeria japonica TaxID=3369 RepID=UPI002414B2C3|nr:bark storage protein A [Cryptomeria japonica]GLJ30640.1 hypothetical protein SUGI_0606750 [Cryptomeria japonica]